MIAILLAAAVSVIHAPPEIGAHLHMDKDGSISGVVENATAHQLAYVHVACKDFDAAGLVVDAPGGYAARDLGPHEAARFARMGFTRDYKPVRFECFIRYEKNLSR